MKYPVHRVLIIAESSILLAPATVLALLAWAYAVLSALRSPADALIAANGVLALVALFATWSAVGAFRSRGDEGLLSLQPGTVVAMGMGLLLVGLGALGQLVETFAEPIDTGALSLNLLGLPAVVPCVHVLWLRAHAGRARGKSASNASGTRVLVALAALGGALLVLQAIITGPVPFDPGHWVQAAHRDDPWHRRQRMADWLVLDGSLVGRSRGDIVARLGEPDRYGHAGAMAFPLGEGRESGGFGIDVLWLSLDARERVVRAKVMTQGD